MEGKHLDFNARRIPPCAIKRHSHYDELLEENNKLRRQLGLREMENKVKNLNKDIDKLREQLKPAHVCKKNVIFNTRFIK